MYLTLDIPCPHCLKENACIMATGSERKVEPYGEYETMFACRSCNRGIIVTTEPSVHGLGPWEMAKASPGTGHKIPNQQFRIKSIFPENHHPECPEGIPDGAVRPYIEACENIKRGNFSTAVILTRKTLDIATTALISACKTQNSEDLKNRINILRDKGMITREMQLWAH